MFDADKTRMIGLPYGEKSKNYDKMLSHFHLIPERHGQTDRHNFYISVLTRDKNVHILVGSHTFVLQQTSVDVFDKTQNLIN